MNSTNGLKCIFLYLQVRVLKFPDNSRRVGKLHVGWVQTLHFKLISIFDYCTKKSFPFEIDDHTVVLMDIIGPRVLGNLQGTLHDLFSLMRGRCLPKGKKRR